MPLDGVLGEGSDAVTVGLANAAAAGGQLTISSLSGGNSPTVRFSCTCPNWLARNSCLQRIERKSCNKLMSSHFTKQIGKALLPDSVSSNALPAPAEASPAAATGTVEKTESVAEEKIAPPKVELPPYSRSQSLPALK
ncbi:hypothetical protein HAX54_010389 [Datura stramonium]|uniref:Uncharacterized protein n=1 Tax=Datura stramonium TaxID=4076 RepID=A0ABS8THY9_DATST|nr:hypothetical protein [Datura stramonium]